MAKVVWITGCSRGLGKAMYEGFRARGWQVAGCARAVTGQEEGFLRPVDVRDGAAVEKFCQEARQEVGAPDLLINNAGLMNQRTPLWEVTEEDFAGVMDVNLKGVANMIRSVVPLMIERGSGVVVNFSSGWGKSVSEGVAPYCASKWGVEGLTAALALELPPGLAAIALSPGVINTDMLRKAMNEAASQFDTAEEWGEVAVPFIEKLGPQDNGSSLRVP